MKKIAKITVLFYLIALLSNSLLAQVKDYKNLPDFDYNDYNQNLSFMVKPFAMTGQTLYLQNVSDTLNDYFFVGSIAKHEDGDRNKITYYKLSRMNKEDIKKLEGSWFTVAGYIADQFAYNKIYKAKDEKRDFKNMQYPFMKLVVGTSSDTIFYNYQNFYNQYNFPFTPMSYYNSNKNEYPNNKYAYDDLNLINYDTNANYAIVPDKLIGQRLTLPVVTDATYERLFNGTRLYNYYDDSRKYSFTDYPLAKARLLEGKTFLVSDVAFDGESLTNVYLKLVIPNRYDTIYYKYPVKQERDLFPFVIESFYNKMRKEYKDKEFIVRGGKFPLTVIDLRRKTPLTLHQGDKFHCLDFVVRDGKFMMLMRNEKGRKFYMPADYTLGDMLCFNKFLVSDQVEKYKTTYPTYYKAICQKELIKGMTMDMANLSWGKADRDVPTNFDGSDRHWFYMGNIYVIFKNNVLYRVAMIPKELR
jgi:hypothetical protein